MLLLFMWKTTEISTMHILFRGFKHNNAYMEISILISMFVHFVRYDDQFCQLINIY